MKILITGGAGLLGSHLCEKYVAEGHKVVCMDNLSGGSIWHIRHLLDYKNFKVLDPDEPEQADIRKYEAVEKAAQEADAIIHTAAQIHVDRSYIDPVETYEVNVMGTQNVLEAARKLDIPKVLYSSTSEVYGSAIDNKPMDENHPLNAPHPYGASKIAADRMCHAYIQTYHMDIRIIRHFNFYGPRQRDFGYAGVIAKFVRRALQDQPPVIYGSGDQTRDYTYVEDAAKAYDLMLKHEEPIPEPINFGTGVDISILDLAKLIIELAGKDLEPEHTAPRTGEVKRLVCNPAKAKLLLGWKPKYTLREGLLEYISWYRRFGFDLKPG